MLTSSLLLGIAVLLVAHEYLAARPRRPGDAVRRVLLVAVFALAVVFGARANLSGRVESAIAAWSAEPVAFEISGDPFLAGALQGQRPARPFPSGGSADDIRAWQSNVVETIRARSDLPASPPGSVPVRVLETREIEGGIQRMLIDFESWDGTRIPAYVHQPSAGTRGGGILVIPGHGQGIRATAGVGVTDYQHAVALEFAKRGFVTLTPELRGFGLLVRDGMPAHGVVAHSALQAGSFYKAVVARDLQFAMSALEHWQRVDPSRLAVAGTSLGGELAVFFAALDPRPRVIVSHSYGGGIGPVSVPETAGDLTRQPPHGCHTVPGINRILYREDWFRLLAPRAVQVVRGADNVSERAGSFHASASEAHARLDAGGRFEFLVEPGGHEFFVAPAVRFLEKWL